MAIKPILFNTEMVRAILDGRKTCTRRVVKTRRKDACGFYVTRYSDGSFAGIYEYDEDERMFENSLIPPYKPGDILYVRETWHRYTKRVGEGGKCHLEERYGYKASIENSEDADEPWRPSIHMPKEAARIWLKVTDVRVERLQECGEGWCLDIEKEGIVTPQNPILYISDDAFHEALRLEFQKVWDSTIKKSDRDRYGWQANPYVWKIEFERCKKPKEAKT